MKEHTRAACTATPQHHRMDVSHESCKRGVRAHTELTVEQAVCSGMEALARPTPPSEFVEDMLNPAADEQTDEQAFKTRTASAAEEPTTDHALGTQSKSSSPPRRNGPTESDLVSGHSHSCEHVETEPVVSEGVQPTAGFDPLLATSTLKHGACSSRFPVSADGSCPYCGSWNVQLLVLTAGTTDQHDNGVRSAAGACEATATASEAIATDVAGGACDTDVRVDDASDAAASASDANSSAATACAREADRTEITGNSARHTRDGGGSDAIAVPCRSDADSGLSEVVAKLLELNRAARVTATATCPEPSSFRCFDCTCVVPAHTR